MWALFFGYASIGCWFVVFTPQLWENYVRKNTDGVSVTFLLLWILGDIFNLVGVFLEDLLITMLLIALYYLFADTLLMGQVIYYRWKNGENNKNKLSSVNESTRLLDDETNIEVEMIVPKNPARTRRTVRIFAFLSTVLSSIMVLGSAYYLFGMEEKADIRHLHVLPQILGYLSALLYCCSRIPQIMHNFRNESVEGLSLWMFVFSVAGNVTYCVSIFVKSLDRTYLLTNYPWILGSGGTLFFDFTVSLRLLFVICCYFDINDIVPQ
ncbi:PQ loop repeat-domain-containing protein [Phascolomyces articulosus]|uniref:PQ loop repeat-domain-containing protein n=1 Tax=Phascolomyces articulosus TaxID=60185 RepID=A0AAD5P809_9FUNG|nr:PQ loop repeat-domain-containing protein [Phascolomyces articulosus]